MFDVLRAILIKNYVSGDGMEGARRDAADVLAMNAVTNGFPAAHPVLQGALAERISAGLLGEQAPTITKGQLLNAVRTHEARSWVRSNYGHLSSVEQDALHKAIVDARGY